MRPPALPVHAGVRHTGPMSATDSAAADSAASGSPDAYLDSLDPTPRAWVAEFLADTAARYPQVPLTMFRSVPMFKFDDSYLTGYVMFSGAAKHFSAHAIDFDLVEQFKARVGGGGKAKGCVQVPYTADPSVKAVLREFVDAVMARHGYATAEGDNVRG